MKESFRRAAAAMAAMTARFGPRTTRPVPPGPREGWSLEVQIHPSDIRRPVRYLFLNRPQVTAWSLAALVFLLLVAFAAAVSPSVVGGFLSRREHADLLAERARQGERLQALVGRLGELEGESRELNARMSKIFLAYGLSAEGSRGGYGGYPFAAAPVPGTIYSAAIHQGNRVQARVDEQLRVVATFLAEVAEFERLHQEQVRTTPSLCPLTGAEFVLTSPFGRRRSPFTQELDFHPGLDLAAAKGTPVRAPADALVVFAGRYPLSASVGWWRYGNLVVLKHGERFLTLYGHCEEVRVRSGQRVRQGDLLATVGSTGWSTNPHLHYEVRRREEGRDFLPVDPRIYILDRRWRDEERLLVQARSAPPAADYEPLPPLFTR